MMWASFGRVPATSKLLERGDVDPVRLELDRVHVRPTLL